MARKNNMKSDNAASIHFDTRTKAVMAEVNSEDKVNIKEKVTAVRELVPGKSTNEIVLVLQYYDYNVERAIQAYLEDGAKEALTEWHFTGNKPPSKKKKNKKTKASASQSGTPSLSTSSDKKDGVPNHTKEPITNGDVHEDEELLRVRARLLDGDNFKLPAVPGGAGATADPAPVPVTAPAVTPTPTPTPTPDLDVARANSPPGAEAHPAHHNKHPHRHSDKHDKHSGAHHHGNQHAHQRQRTSSERSTSSISSQVVKKPFAGLEKSTKDLQRQTISLERLRLGLDAEIEKAYKRVKAVFEDARNSLLDREVQLIREVDALKVQAKDVFRMRQTKAAELKVRVERAEKLDNNELAELRADIKLFVSDRKIDEDLCKTTRFTYDSDHFMEEVKNFGTVVPVKCLYSTRRPSVSSVASSGHGQDEPISPGLRPHAMQQPMHTDVDSAAVPDNNLSMKEMAELQLRLKNSLQLQGLPVKSPPPRNRPATAPAQKPEGDHEEDFRRNRHGRRRRGPRETPHDENTESPKENHSNVSQPAQSNSPQGSSPEKTDRPNTGNRSPRRNYSGGQSSPRRYGSGGQRGRGGSRGRGGDGYPDDSGYRRDERRPRGRGEGQGRGGRGREYRGRDGRGRDGRGRDGSGQGGSRPAPQPDAQSSQGGSKSSSGNPAVVNGPTTSNGN